MESDVLVKFQVAEVVEIKFLFFTLRTTIVYLVYIIE